MKIECGIDRTELPPVDEADVNQLSRWLIRHFVQQGVTRGYLYGAGVGVFLWVIGAGVGVFLWVIGAVFGCVIGALAGLLVGFLDGVVLAGIARRHQRRRGSIGDFIATAAWVAPLLTFCACELLCCIFAAACDLNTAEGQVQASSLGIALLVGLIPAAVAAFASWQSVQKMWDWYVPRPVRM